MTATCRRTTILLAVGVLVLSLLPPIAASAQLSAPSATSDSTADAPVGLAALGSGDWLGRLNAARANAGLAPVTDRPDWSEAARLHARYLVHNQVLAHGEDPTLAGSTAEGSWAARTGNLYGSSQPGTPTEAVHAWLDSPGHAAWILRPGLREVGFGDHTGAEPGPLYRYGAVLPVVEGVDRSVAPPDRVTYPGHGSVLRTHPDEGRAAALHAVYLFRPDLAGIGASRLDAIAWVDGSRVRVRDVEPVTGGIAVLLERALPSDADVAVVTLVDDRYDDRWTFTTSRRTAAPPIANQVPTPSLWDVDGTVHATSIHAMAAAGRISGFRDGSFQAAAGVSRGQLATVLAHSLRLPSASPSGTGLRDVAGSAHAGSIASVVAAGFMSGHPDGTFRPSVTVTRGQLATVLAEALALPPDPAAAAGYRDVVGTTHQHGITAVLGAGLASGFPDGTFRPGATVSRGQLATVLAGAFPPG